MRRCLPILALLTLAVSTPAVAGPPWISIELPANPYTTGTRGAFCLVRVYHHGDPAYTQVVGTAEGLVNGERRTISLKLEPTGLPGVYAVQYTPESRGTWMLVFRVGGEKEYEGATAVVQLGAGGSVTRAYVPTRQEGRHTIPTPVSRADIDRMLKETAAG